MRARNSLLTGKPNHGRVPSSEKKKAKWQGNIENRKEVRARKSLLTGEGNMENTPSEKKKATWQELERGEGKEVSTFAAVEPSLLLQKRIRQHGRNLKEVRARKHLLLLQ